MTALSRLWQEIETSQRALYHHRTVLLKQGVLNEHAAPFGQQPKRFVELRHTVGARCLQLAEQLLADVVVQAHAGKCCWISARISSSPRGDWLASAQRSKCCGRTRVAMVAKPAACSVPVSTLAVKPQR